MEQAAVTVPATITRTRSRRKAKRYGLLALMMVPGLLYFLINNYLPMFGLMVAFKDVNFSEGMFSGKWVGLKNFEYLFKTTDAYIITRNTLLYNGTFIIINTVAAIAVAILLNEIKNKLFMRFYQSVVLIPYLISTIIISYLVFSMLSTETGFVNKTILPLFGMEGISWYSEAKYWPFILTIVNIWKGVGFLCVIYLASMIGIDPEYYEAATIDGASKFQQIRAITLPLIVPTIITMTLLAIGRIFYSDFGLFYQVPMNAGALYDTTNVIDTYVYRGLMQLGDIGMSSAAGMYQSLVGLVLVLVSNYIVRKINRENSLF
ncbi:ABC transporter permease [Paenibacillus hodogayensis]|uniref:ABC transporter permease n=1 Tax=Paenibacillus hodogayensis TaxID=279208 RepID=A0ABV5VZM3_9BACL